MWEDHAIATMLKGYVIYQHYIEAMQEDYTIATMLKDYVKAMQCFKYNTSISRFNKQLI